MEELSIEEKAKAYDEAIERAKDFMNGKVHYALKKGENIMCWIFPELKESEDERIRKELIEFVKSRLAGFPQCDKYLAWLEKQGEKKPIDKIQIGKIYKCIASPRYSTFMKGVIYKPEDKFLCSLMNFCSDCFEPIEDDEKKPAFEMKTPEESLGIDSETYSRVVDECIYGGQNPAEWSEEDEQLYNDLSDTYFYNDEDYPEETYKRMLKKVLDWMNKRAKSLRPQSQWKPSDEEMKALADALSLANNCGEENAFDLRTLYEQLKKPREE